MVLGADAMTALQRDDARAHPEPLAGVIGALALDRQRIVCSSAFRRLQYKTQVFLARDSDHFRSRLTHTLEVANLARLMAARLQLNIDLAEVVALAHDLGHPPFGHAGERALNDCLREAGGFEHNDHALRVVEYLEHPYPTFRGLNLTRVVRECLARHSTRYDRPSAATPAEPTPAPLEGQVAALADRVTYTLHDLQDALYAGLLEADALADLPIWSLAGLEPPQQTDWRARLRPAIEGLQLKLVAALECSRAESESTRDERAGALATRSVTNLGWPPELRCALEGLEDLLLQRVYRHPQLVRMDAKAERVLRAVFDAYAREPALLPRRFADRVPTQGVLRVAGDYVAGMTDRFCLREHERLFDPRVDA